MKQITKKLLFLSCLTLSLQGCVFVAGAAVGVAAIAIVYDHRPLSKVLEDTKIANRIAEKINAYPLLSEESHIEVTVFNRVVLITGETPNVEWRNQVTLIARSIPEVTRVYNQITIQGTTSALTRTSDSWITTKIKGQMLAASDLKSSSIKVLTENGVVYLMGIVTRQQAETAVEISRQVSGVLKVVKIFEYTD